MPQVETVIGLEVHCQLNTRTKAFCRCPSRGGQAPNSNTCPVCLGLPGALPVLNRAAVEQGIRLALALKCRVNPVSVFARKHYFYPDLPKGYQITQYDQPLAAEGRLELPGPQGGGCVAIRRVHLEEDAGSAQHDLARGETLLDYNRCGVPLAEVVTEPVLRSPDEAVAYLKELRDTVRFLGICDGNMEAGSFRCDANVSVRMAGTAELGNRVELKNLNSFKYIRRGLEYEVQRQTELLLAGQQIAVETRLFDEKSFVTQVMRGKEQVQDYRYFPEPDLPPLWVGSSWVSEIERGMERAPAWYRERFLGDYGLPWYEAEVLTGESSLARYAMELLGLVRSPLQAAHWVMTEVLGVVNERGWSLEQFPVPATELAELLCRLEAGRISSTVAKRAFLRMWSEGLSSAQALEGVDEGLLDERSLSEACRGVVDAHPAEVARYRGGKASLMRWFVGTVIRSTGGKADPRRVEELLRAMLEENRS